MDPKTESAPISPAKWIGLSVAVMVVAGLVWLASIGPEPGPAVQGGETRPAVPSGQTSTSSSFGSSGTVARTADFLRQEKEISELIVSQRTTGSKAGELIRMLPTLAPDLQELAAGHIAHLAEGAQIQEMTRLMADERVVQAAREALLSGLYNQDPMVAAGSFIQILEKGPESFSAEAQRSLSLMLQADHGTDVAAWKKEWAAAKIRLAK